MNTTANKPILPVYEATKYRGKKYNSLEEAMVGQRLNQLIHTMKNKDHIKSREHNYYVTHIKPKKDKLRAEKSALRKAEKLLSKLIAVKLGTKKKKKKNYYKHKLFTISSNNFLCLDSCWFSLRKIKTSFCIYTFLLFR
jgi:hypothetical protein